MQNLIGFTFLCRQECGENPGFIMEIRNYDNKLKIYGLIGLGVVLLLGGLLSECSQRADEAEQAQREAAAKLAQKEEKERLARYFEANRKAVIDEVLAEIEAGAYWRARRIAAKYEHVADPYLISLESQAREKQLLKRIDRAEKSDAAKLYAMYSELTDLVPGSREYQERKRHYKNIVDQEKAAAKARQARYGSKPTEAEVYTAVRRHLRQSAHDPDSIRDIGCTYTVFTERGWMTACQYRGSNAFGATITDRSFFYLRHGTVVAMSETRQ